MADREDNLGGAQIWVAFVVLVVPLLVDAGAAAADPASRVGVVFTLDNRGDAARVRISIGPADGNATIVKDLDVPARSIVADFVAHPEGELRASAQIEGILTTTAEVLADTRGCDGDFKLVFTIDGGLVGADDRRNGCTKLPRAARHIIEATRQDGRSGQRIEIPMPRDSDKGIYIDAIGEELAFAWEGPIRVRDAWSRDTEAMRVVFQRVHGSTCRSQLVTPATASRDPEVDAPASWLAYGGSPRPLARADPRCDASLTVGLSNQARQGEYEVIDYRGAGEEACLFRHELQGMAFSEAAIQDLVMCGWGPTAWSASNGEGRLVLHAAREDADGALAVRIELANGIAYPLSLEIHRFAAGGVATTSRYTLARLGEAGSRIQTAAAPSDPSILGLRAVDPWRGPAGGDVLPFSLAQAADAARTDPTLLGLRSLRDPHLAAALYRVRSDAGTRAVIQTWDLLFVTKEGAIARESCDNVISAPTPVVRCSEGRQSLSTIALLGSPPPGHALHEIGIGFDVAKARWGREEPNFARYRGWSEEGAPAFVEIGEGAAERLAPIEIWGTIETSRVAVELATGRTWRAIAGETRMSDLGLVPEFLVPAAGAQTGRDLATNGIPSFTLTAALVGIAVLLVLVLVFTRLARPRVLEASVRAEIHAIVEARPGIHEHEVVRHFSRGHGLIEYHLSVLVREGYVVRHKFGGFRRYYRAGRFTMPQMAAIAALREGQNAQLFRLVESHPGITLRDLAAATNMSAATASRGVARLSKVGLVAREQDGRTLRLRAIDPIMDLTEQ